MPRLLAAVLFLLAAASVETAAGAPVPAFSASRESGCVAPCAVFFDATQTTDPDFEREFHTLHYVWDFGDERGEAWRVSGRPKNRAIGGIAGHLYASPGRYTVTLSVTNPRGEVARAVRSLVVEDPEVVFAGPRTNCVSVGGDFEGCPEGAFRIQSSDFDATLANGDGRRTLYRRGETFVWDRSVALVDASTNGASIAAFGDGEARVGVRATSVVSFDANHDWRIAQLEFQGPGLGEHGAPFRERKGVRRFTVYDVGISGYNNCFEFWSPAHPDEEIAVVEFRCGDFPDPGNGAKFFEDSQRSFFLGLEIDKGDMKHPDDRSEFVHRSVFNERKVLQHSRYQGRAPNHSKNVLQLRHCASGGRWTKCTDGANTSRYVIVSDNHFIEEGGPRASAVIRVCDQSQCRGAPGDSQPVEDYIFERNLVQLDFERPESERLRQVFQLQAARSTVRNNVLDLQGWPAGGGGANAVVRVSPMSNSQRDDNDGIWVLHNTVYLGEGFPRTMVLCDAPSVGVGHLCANNLLYAPKLRGERMVVRGPGWTQLGSLSDGGTGAGRYTGNPFAGPSGPLGASMTDLSGFQLDDDRGGTPEGPPGTKGAGGHPAVDGGADLRAAAGTRAYLDASSRCRPAGGAPDVGALELGASACNPKKPEGPAR